MLVQEDSQRLLLQETGEAPQAQFSFGVVQDTRMPEGAHMYCRVAPILVLSVQEDSERLLQETGEALDAQLSLAGVQDIRAMLAAVDEGRSLHPLHLTAVASHPAGRQSC